MARYLVTVKFGSGGNVVVAVEQAGGDPGELAVSVKSPPERGRANRELVRRLANHFGVPESSVRIVSGLASRKKIVEIFGLPEDDKGDTEKREGKGRE